MKWERGVNSVTTIVETRQLNDRNSKQAGVKFTVHDMVRNLSSGGPRSWSGKWREVFGYAEGGLGDLVCSIYIMKISVAVGDRTLQVIAMPCI